jgi:hypothetical protein
MWGYAVAEGAFADFRVGWTPPFWQPLTADNQRKKALCIDIPNILRIFAPQNV